jgi:hypothetical protein
MSPRPAIMNVTKGSGIFILHLKLKLIENHYRPTVVIDQKKTPTPLILHAHKAFPKNSNPLFSSQELI